MLLKEDVLSDQRKSPSLEHAESLKTPVHASIRRVLAEISPIRTARGERFSRSAETPSVPPFDVAWLVHLKTPLLASVSRRLLTSAVGVGWGGECRGRIHSKVCSVDRSLSNGYIQAESKYVSRYIRCLQHSPMMPSLACPATKSVPKKIMYRGFGARAGLSVSVPSRLLSIDRALW